jgi:hypothetical protein
MIVVIIIIVLLVVLGAGGWFGGFIPSTKPYYKKKFSNKDTSGYNCDLYSGTGNAPVDLLGSEKLGDYQDAVDFWKTTCGASAGLGGDLTPPAPPSEFDKFFTRWEGKPHATVERNAQVFYDAKVAQAKSGTITQAQMDEALSILQMAKANTAEGIANEALNAATTEEERRVARQAVAKAERDGRATEATQKKAEKDARQNELVANAALAAADADFANKVAALNNDAFAVSSFMMLPGEEQTAVQRPGLTPTQCIQECADDAQCTNINFKKGVQNCEKIMNNTNPDTGRPYDVAWQMKNPGKQRMRPETDAQENDKLLRGFRRISSDTATIRPNENNQRCGKFIMDSIRNRSDPAMSIITNHGPMNKNLKKFCGLKDGEEVIDGWDEGGEKAWNPVCKNAYANGCYIPCEATIYGARDFKPKGAFTRGYLAMNNNDGESLKGDMTDYRFDKTTWDNKVESVILGAGCDRMEISEDYEGNSDFEVIFPDVHGLDNYVKQGARMHNDASVKNIKGSENRRKGRWIGYNKNLTNFIPRLDKSAWRGFGVNKGVKQSHNGKDLGYSKAYDFTGDVTGINVVQREILR